MKASEALLRCIAAEGGTIDGTRPQEWIGKLYEAGLLEKGDNFTWKLTDQAKDFLRRKGVEV